MIPLIAWLLVQVATTSVFAQRAEIAAPIDPLAIGASLANEAVVICTPGGFVVIRVDSDGEKLPDDSTFYPGCQWCQPFGGPAAIAGPEQPGLPLPTLGDCRYETIVAQVPAQSGGTGAFQSRAPPL